MEEEESKHHFINVSLEAKGYDFDEVVKDTTTVVVSNAEKCESNEEAPVSLSSDHNISLAKGQEDAVLEDTSTVLNSSTMSTVNNNSFNGLVLESSENGDPHVSSQPSLSSEEAAETKYFTISDVTDQTVSETAVENFNNQKDSFESSDEQNDACPKDVSRSLVDRDLCQVAPCSSLSPSTPSLNDLSLLNNRVEVENYILKEINKVLTSLGFCMEREKESSVGGIDTHPEEDSSMQQSPLSLSDFIPSLQYQLSKFKLASEKFRDDHYTEVQGLERALSHERSRLENQETTAAQIITQLKTDLDKKHQLYEAANKAKEGMVVKYAMSEKSVITVKKDLELAERRLREANKARDLLSDRLKTVQSEKEKANNLLETKGQEFSTINRENQRLKEDLRWTQNKLKTESESKKEAEQRITELIKKLEEARLEAEQSHKDAQNAIKSFQVSEENKAVSLDHQLREQHAKLILERHGRADTQVLLKQLQVEVDSLKAKQQDLISENNQLSIKVQTLEKERLDGDQRLSRLKQESDKHHQEVADLREKLVGMESLRAQLQHNEDQLSTCRNEMERLRQTNVELQQDAAACREREAELLDFTQKLTEKNVRLQSEFSALEAKAQMLEGEQQPLTRRLTDAETKVQSLTKGLEEEQKLRQEENSILARHLAESTHRLEQTQQLLEDSQGEIEVLKRKHAASIRELTREIQQSRKRQEMAENTASSGHHSSCSSTSIAQGSRTSSSSSINTVCEPSPSPLVAPVIFPNGQEPDKQVLIERLVKLQKENAKKAEKLDFMEEHSQVLISELQKKTRLIQSFVMKMPAGALSSESMDQNKADLAKKTGIMASMYGSRHDETMSAELSMEINRKLQAVLEDTLLKNITLKESIDTLGAEIARLSSKSTGQK